MNTHFLCADTRAFVDRLFEVVTGDKYMPESEEKERKIDEKTKESASSHKEKPSKSLRHEDKSPKSSRHDERVSRSSRHEDKSPRSSRHDERTSRNSRHEDKSPKSSRHDERTSRNSRHEDRLSRSSRHEDRPSKNFRHNKRTRSEERSPKKSHRHEERTSKKKEEDKSSVLPPGVDSVVDSYDRETKKRKSDGTVEALVRFRDEGEEATMKSAKIKRPRITPPDFDMRTGVLLVLRALLRSTMHWRHVDCS